jgi:hypothetical protein
MRDVRRRSFFVACALALLLSFSSGCGGDSSSPTEPDQAPEQFVIESISPALGTRLTRGTTLDFSVTARYQMRAASSEATLLVLDQDGNILPGASGSEVASVVRGRTGTFILSNRVTLPATGLTSVRVRVSLSALEQPLGAVSDEREYAVE